MSLDVDEMYDRTMETLRSLLTQVGVEVQDDEPGKPVFVSPVELLGGMRPHEWLRGAAVNIVEVIRCCTAVVTDLASVQEGRRPEGWDSEWDWYHFYHVTVAEVQCHVFNSVVFAQEIRDAVFEQSDHDTLWKVLPFLRPMPSTSHDLGLTPATARLEDHIESIMDPVSARTVAEDMRDLYLHCGLARFTIADLISEPHADFTVLAQRFANMQSALIELGLVLLRADTSVLYLTRREPVEHDESDT